MNETKLHYQVETYVFRRKHDLFITVFMGILAAVIILGLVMYCIPKVVLYAIRFGYNETYVVCISTTICVLLVIFIAFGTVMFLVYPMYTPITIVENIYPKTLTLVLDNINLFNEGSFRKSIG